MNGPISYKLAQNTVVQCLQVLFISWSPQIYGRKTVINWSPLKDVDIYYNLMHQMVCYTEPSEKSSLETVWKRAGTFKKYLAGDWMNHLSITVYHCLTL